MRAFSLACTFAFLVTPLPAADGGAKDAGKISRQLELFTRANRPKEIHGLLVEMTGSEDPKVVALLPPAGTAIPSAANFLAAVEAIEKLQTDAAVQALVGALKKKSDYRQRVLILDAFARRSDPASLAAIVEQLKSGVVHVQVAAIRAARARKQREPIPVLIELLGDHWKARNRVWYECHAALVDLTGKDFEAIEDWKNFWGAIPDSFDPKKVGEEKGSTRIAAVKRTEDSVEFFGSEIFSQNLVFVIDVSGSMFMYDQPSAGGKADDAGSGDDDAKPGTTKVAGGAKAGGGKGAGPAGAPGGRQTGNVEEDRQRLRRAKEQLTRAVKKLPKSALFNIITFSDKVLAWQKRLQPATPANLAAALKFVNEFQAWGATHTDEALDLAFEDLGVDTIVLLSDGAPVHKDADSKLLIPKILEKVRDVNSARKVTIHTFGFEGQGTWPAKVPKAGGMKLPPPPSAEEVKTFVEFLKSIAKENGGEFQAIR